MSVFGALLMYIMSMAALFKLRMSEPNLVRTYKTPFYPVFPAIALSGAVIALATVIWFNLMLAGVFISILLLGLACFHLTRHSRDHAAFDASLAAVVE